MFLLCSVFVHFASDWRIFPLRHGAKLGFFSRLAVGLRGKRGFLDQVLSTGAGSKEGTWVSALWLNAVQEEIVNTLQANQVC